MVLGCAAAGAMQGLHACHTLALPLSYGASPVLLLGLCLYSPSACLHDIIVPGLLHMACAMTAFVVACSTGGSPSITDRLKEDMKAAMKAKEQARAADHVARFVVLLHSRCPPGKKRITSACRILTPWVARFPVPCRSSAWTPSASYRRPSRAVRSS